VRGAWHPRGSGMGRRHAPDATIIILVVAFVAYAVRVAALLVRYDGYELGKYLFADDAFYYLRIAGNIVRGRGSTFDGSAITNGYHPLWELCCIVITSFFPAASRTAVVVVFALQSALNAFSAATIYAALRPLRAIAASVAVALLLASAAIQGTLTNGMESTLGFAWMAVLLRFAVVRGRAFVILDTRRYALVMFALLGALALTRLEMGLVAVVFLTLSVRRCRAADGPGNRAALRRALYVLMGLSTVGFAYLAINQAMFGSPVPISGIIKWTSAQTTQGQLLSAQAQLRAFVAPLRIHQSMQRPFVEAWLAILLFVALARKVARETAMREVFLVLGLPCLLFMMLVTATSSGFQWYGWPALFLGTLATFALFDDACEWVASACSSWRSRVEIGLAALICAFTASATLARVGRAEGPHLFDWSLPPTLMDHAIRFVRERIPPGELLCGHSVGLLSYMTDRAIVHTEGLVNDRAYFEAMRHGRAADALRARGVRWLIANVVDREDEAMRRALFPSCAVIARDSVVDEYDLVATPDAARKLAAADVVFFRIDYAACSLPVALYGGEPVAVARGDR
jgi:hypothetical protein